PLPPRAPPPVPTLSRHPPLPPFPPRRASDLSVAVPGTTFTTRPAPFPAASLTSAAPSGATNTSDANGIVPGGTTSWPAAVTAVVRVSASGIAYTVSPVAVVPHPSPVKQLSTT